MSIFAAPVDGVEIKFTMSGSQIAQAARSFGVSLGGGRRFFVAFFDAPHTLRMLRAGVVLRIRERAAGGGRLTLKLRPAKADRLINDWAAGSTMVDDYRVEYDWSQEPVLAASLATQVEPGVLEAVKREEVVVDTLLSPDQNRFFRECGPSITQPFSGLRIAGPILTFQWDDDIAPDSIPGLRAEQWGFDDTALFFEVSVRVDDVADAERARSQLAEELKNRSLIIDTDTHSKTEVFLNSRLG